nr:chromosomal replication initiator DnaA [Sphingobium subterraneum]
MPFDWAGQGAQKAGAGEPGGGDAFIVSDANRLAARHIEQWRDWPIPVAVLSGPPRSGRTTLARHFAAISSGTIIDPVEGMTDEALFHAWNRALDTHTPLLLVAGSTPAQWTVTLPDLRSRLAAAPHVAIAEPDHDLVRALIETGLARAGSAFSADAPEWISRRLERRYAVVAAVLALLNQASLSSSRKISVPFAKEALHNAGFLPIVDDDAAPETDRPGPDSGE